MHELADTQRILEVALQHAQQAGARRITSLHVVLGHESHISDESVQFYWDEISKGTPAEGARLHFRYVPAEMVCETCGHHFTLAGHDHDVLCPQCQGGRVRFAAGEEFYLEAIDVETDAEAQG